MADLPLSQLSASAADGSTGAERAGAEVPALQLAEIHPATTPQYKQRRRQRGAARDAPPSWSTAGLDRPRLRSLSRRQQSIDIAHIDDGKYVDVASQASSLAPEKQNRWMKRAMLLYNVDKDHILMSEEHKRLSLLYFANHSPLPNKDVTTTLDGVVRNALKMVKGEEIFDAMVMITALIRWNLHPPSTWTKYIVVLECLECLDYLDDCVDGRKEYSKKGMMIVKPEELSWNHDNRSWYSEQLRVSCEVLVIEPLRPKSRRCYKVR